MSEKKARSKVMIRKVLRKFFLWLYPEITEKVEIQEESNGEVIFCKPTSEEEIYKEAQNLEDYLNKIKKI